jgi:hypothetical protein
LAYLLMPPATILLSGNLLSWHYEWLERTLEEFFLALVLVYIAAIFAPVERWLLLRAFDRSAPLEAS